MGAEPVSIGLTRDLEGRGGLDLLAREARLRLAYLGEHRPVVAPEQVEGFDAVLSFSPHWTAESFAAAERLTALLRVGVGYDQVDVAACTRADVVLCTTVGSTSHSMAEAIVTWMLALTHRVRDKDRLLREGRWAERDGYTGCELRDRTLGLVGLGGIGERLVGMLAGFGMRPPIACDPFARPERAAALGVRLLPLEPLLGEADFVVLCCPLDQRTRGLIGRAQLDLMKPQAYLINTARGPIVDEAALCEALAARRIAGAAVDVFAVEPAGADHPLARLDNVILAPHCIGWTAELERDNGRAASANALAIAAGEVPAGKVVNREVLERPGFRKKLERLRERRIACTP